MKIDTIRHSLSHILAYAVQELYPGTKFGIGPATKEGFYYDFDIPKPLTNEDLLRIEKKMKELINKNIKFKKQIISEKKAREIFKNQPYKLEIINDLINAHSLISVYKSGKFIDLCKGPHVKSTKEIAADSFKLTKIAGAYWKGKERNPMLQRIYGVAFKNKKELNNYFQKEAETEKRDHRLLGHRLSLFHIDENVGPGLILWHSKGALLKKIIEDFVLDIYLKQGYQLVCTPHIAKINLWRTSGHLDFYKEDMFPPMHMREIEKEEKEDYQLKPMNCPFHIAIYRQNIKSYKQLPLRYTELGTVYRYERTGTLHGLTRARGFTQDDAHIFCTPSQLAQEIISIIKLTFKILKAFSFKDFKIYLSTRPDKFVGEEKIWRKAEKSLRFALNKLKLKYEVDKGGGAFYGPKIDIKIKDALEREWQCTTIQIDFNLPERFDISYINEKGKKKRPIMVHRALLGSVERFIGILLEYHSGNLPLWLSPEQIWVIPVGSEHRKYASEVTKKLSEAGIRCKLKDEAETVSRKIREGEIQKIPYLLVVGNKEKKSKTVRVRERIKKDSGMIKLSKFIEKINLEIQKKK